MKLGKVTSNDLRKRISLSVHQSTIQRLQHYQSFYKREQGDEIDMSLLVEEMCKAFMHEDRAFIKFIAAQEALNKASGDTSSSPTSQRNGVKT